MKRNPWEKDLLLGDDALDTSEVTENQQQPQDLRTQLYQSLLEKAKARREAAEKAASGAPQVNFDDVKSAARDRNLMAALLQNAARIGGVKSNFGDYAARQNELDSQEYAERQRLDKNAQEAGFDELKLAMGKSDLDEKLQDRAAQRSLLTQKAEQLSKPLDPALLSGFNSAMQKYGINVKLPDGVTYGQVQNMPFVAKVFEQLPELQMKFMDLEGKKVDRDNQNQQQAFGRSNELSKEYYNNQVTKDTQIKRSQHQVISSGLAKNNATGDMAAIFGVMKMFDPGSTVREGEFASAKNAAGVPERIQTLYNNILKGEMLSPQQRKEFQGVADDLLQRQLKMQSEIDAQFGTRAKKSAVDANDFLIGGSQATTQSAQEAPKAPAKNFKDWKKGK